MPYRGQTVDIDSVAKSRKERDEAEQKEKQNKDVQAALK